MTINGYNRAKELEALIEESERDSKCLRGLNTKTNWYWDNPQFTKVVAWRKLPDIYIEEEQ